MAPFSGEEELRQFILNKKHPTFCQFVIKHNAKIAEWTIDTPVTSPQSMHRNWVNHFNATIRKTREDVSLKNTKFIAETWEKLFEELSALRDFQSESRIEGQKLATLSMKKAARRSQRILAEGSGSSPKEVEQEEQELTDQLYKLWINDIIWTQPYPNLVYPCGETSGW